ncbi:MAG TPA: non-canonical purine NTP pyrophosphatase [Candidatus Binataceae bacterium]|nr:non-canonical purine NTP pyrophosphatase [Candidatus Binataceae bacterium]
MNRLLIATTNPAKLAEYRILLHQMDIQLEPVSLADAGITDVPEETGDTFCDNALLKARFYFARAGFPTLADDGGLEVDALGGAPGIHSHRWLGVANPSDRALAEEVIRRMEGVEKRRRTARIRAAIAIVHESYSGGMREVCAEAAIEGLIAPRAFPEIRRGFPYRAVLWLPERACYLGELGDDEEARISQRRLALMQLRDELEALS